MEITVFLSNHSQAARLPKAVTLPGDVKEIEIVTIGRTRIVTPAGESWGSWFDGENVSADLMDIHDQPAMQGRESF